MDLIPN